MKKENELFLSETVVKISAEGLQGGAEVDPYSKNQRDKIFVQGLCSYDVLPSAKLRISKPEQGRVLENLL